MQKELIKGDFMRNIKNNKGYTLVEILLAIALMSIILIPMMQYFIKTAEIEGKTRRELKATYIAQKYLEDYKDYKPTVDDTLIGPMDDEGYQVYVEIKNVTGSGVNEVDFKSSTTQNFGDTVTAPADPAFTIRAYKDTRNSIELVDSVGFYDSNNTNSADDDFRIELEKDSSIYKVRVYRKSGPNYNLLSETNKTFTDATIDINVQVDATNPTDHLILNFVNKTDKKFNIYEIDDTSGVISLNDQNSFSGEDITIYRNILTTSGGTTNSDQLYRMVVRVERDGDLIERIETLIRN